MRKSFVALALLVGAMALLTNLALAQADDGVKMFSPKVSKTLTRASRLGTSAASDTFWIGHVTSGGHGVYHVGGGPGGNRPGLTRLGIWDFEWAADQPDSLQGWIPVTWWNNRTSGSIPDDQRPWMALDYGNRICAGPVQGHAYGVVSAWHVDALAGQADAANAAATPKWAALAGTKSAWCGLRSEDDPSYIDDVARGGTGNPINGAALQGSQFDGLHLTQKNFPGYCNQWDQMLYRDVRIATGGDLTVQFKYATYMSTSLDNAINTATGWFDQDPLNIVAGNFVSASGQSNTGPIDSFMVYVGVPTDPTNTRYSDAVDRTIFDLKRRWFSEVLKINAPYKEIYTTFGQDSVHKTTALSITVPNAEIEPMLASQGATDGGGVIRVVWRVKTNKDFSDETGSGGFQGLGRGAAIIDDVDLNGTGVSPHVTEDFETLGAIDNTVEGPDNASPGPAVGEGYALHKFHATGKTPKIYSHTHPLAGGDIGGGNIYSQLAYDDVCGPPSSRLRNCNIENVVVSTGDHDLNEAAGGPLGTAYKETRQGMISPSINLVTPPTGTNDCGLDAAHANTTDDWILWYDCYMGIFDLFSTGNVWLWGLENFPSTQSNGSVVWGDIWRPTYVLYQPTVICAWDYEYMKGDGLVKTSNPSGIPDSIRVFMGREQRCISFAVTTGCSPTGGHYYDNITMGFPPDKIGSADKMAVDIWQWYNDAFPANETAGLPGTAAFDTAAALVQTGINNAQTAGSSLRFNIPGDSIFIVATHTGTDNYRVDMVFRIKPGPGNYVQAGNVASGLRQVPTSPVQATAGDASFWGQYLASNGTFGSSPGHSGNTWSPDVWNSARCDTAQRNLFPVNGRANNISNLQANRWISTYHELDPKFATLGITKNKCFLIDTSSTAPLTSGNITCSSVPAWLLVPELATRAGFDGNQQTKEFTKIIPDGILTAGSHVEYFFRLSNYTTPTMFVMTPDTSRIFPQNLEGPNFDAHRWQGFGVLPDRWKDAAYGGLGSACLLALDYNDRRGDERAFISLGDSIGMTAASHFGSHNGWYCQGGYIATDGTHDYTNENVGGNGQYDATTPMGGHISIWKHGGQPGTTFDMYQVKAAESANTGGAGIGGRLANRSGMGLATGKQSMQAPTPEMLRTYYKMIYLFSGDLSTTVLGPYTDQGADDVSILENFLSYNADYVHPRGLWVMGDGFAESEDGTGGAHLTLLTDYMGLTLRDPSYYALSGSDMTNPDLTTTAVIFSQAGKPAHVFAAQNGCLWTNDILEVNPAIPGATVAAYYQNLGSSGPYISSVFAPSSATHPYTTLLDGYDLIHLRARFGNTSVGRQAYFMDVLVNVFGSICPFIPTITVDVPENTARTVNFLDNVWGNPVLSGRATVHFGLAKADRVEIKVYDVTGRLVKTLANRNFDAGEHSLVWDGTSDQGQRVSRGVYFTQVKFVNSRFVDAKKVTVLR